MQDTTVKLRVLGGPLAGVEFPLKGAVTTLGRVAENDIVLDDRSISRQHARIELTEGGFMVTDLESQNGTVFDGKRIDRAVVPLGGQVIFGKVPCGLQAAASSGAQLPAVGGAHVGANWSNLPAQVRLLTADDLFGIAAGEPGISPQESTRREEARRRRGLIIYVVSLAAVITLGVFFYFKIGRAKEPPRRSVIIEVDEMRLVSIQGTREHNGQTAVKDENVVQAEVDEIWWIIAVTGMSPGITEVVMKRGLETVCVITVTVFPRERKREPEQNLSDEERIELARGWIDQAVDAEGDHKWYALKLFEKADDLLKYMDPPPAMRDRSRQGILRLRSGIDKNYRELKDNYRGCVGADDWNGALRCLLEMKEAIPDPDDNRHQRAELLMHYALSRLRRHELRYKSWNR